MNDSLMAIEGLQPASVWEAFARLNSIPRCSGNERAVQEFILSEANQSGFECSQDKTGNVIVRIPASNGFEGAPSVCLQGHTDMVCEKNADINHDFDKDPVILIRDGNIIRARNTTLGADNGLGVASMLAIMAEADSMEHPELELLFTIDEERGLTGALSLGKDFIRSKILINTDTEEDAFFIGCAGGADSMIELPVSFLETEGIVLDIEIDGFLGGHSGIDIHRGRGNAIQAVASFLGEYALLESIQIVSFNGGNKRNAIPRESRVRVVVSSTDACKRFLENAIAVYKEQFGDVEKNIRLRISEVQVEIVKAISPEATLKLLAMLTSIYSGPVRFDRNIAGLVETSNNLSSIKTESDRFVVVCNTRSSITSAMSSFQSRMEIIVNAIGGTLKREGNYPGWKPDPDSPLLAKAKSVYAKLFNRTVDVKAVHAGLETGVIGSIFDGMDMLSIGPDIFYPHSPDEYVDIPGVERYWLLLRALLESMRR